MRRWWSLVGWFLLFKFVVERSWNIGVLLSSFVDSLFEKKQDYPNIRFDDELV